MLLTELRSWLRGRHGFDAERTALDALLSPHRFRVLTGLELTALTRAAFTFAPEAESSEIVAAISAAYSAARAELESHRTRPVEFMRRVIAAVTADPLSLSPMAEQLSRADGRLLWVTAQQLREFPLIREHVGGTRQIGQQLRAVGLMAVGSPDARLADGSRAQRWWLTDAIGCASAIAVLSPPKQITA